MSSNAEKVVVAMSGGVDSSVAACLLHEKGYGVIGLFMRTGVKRPDSGDEGPRWESRSSGSAHQGCCSAADAADARFVAGLLGIPFYSLNFENEFDAIIDHFVREYAAVSGDIILISRDSSPLGRPPVLDSFSCALARLRPDACRAVDRR